MTGVPELTVPPGTTHPMGEPPPRFTHGEPVTVIITAAADAEYEVFWGARELPVVSLELPVRPATRVDIAYERPGVLVIHGDITPTILQALKDARAYHWDGQCGDPEHEQQVCQYERAGDALAGRVPLAAVPCPANPG